ncbi:hypothetical protein ACTXT7_017334, partial [Hymenolepis weldensis]
MANDFTVPTSNRLNISECFLFLEAQSHAYEITSQQSRLIWLLQGLTLVVFGKPSTTPYDDPKFAILERMKEPESESSKWLLKELMNGAAKGPQPQKRDNSDPISQMDIVHNKCPRNEVDAEQFHTYNRERSKELSFITGDSNSVRGEKQHCPLELAPAIHKRPTRGKRNTRKPEVIDPPKMPQSETGCQYPQQNLLGISSTTLSHSNMSTSSKIALSTKQMLSHPPPSSEILSQPPPHLNISTLLSFNM